MNPTLESRRGSQLRLAMLAVGGTLLIALLNIPAFVLTLGMIVLAAAFLRIVPQSNGYSVRLFFDPAVSLTGLLGGLLFVALAYAGFTQANEGVIGMLT